MATKKIGIDLKLDYKVDAAQKWLENVISQISVTEQTVAEMVLAASAADEAVGFVGVENAKVLLLVTDAPITAKVNGGAVAIPVETCLLLTGGVAAITSLSLSNASTTIAANVKVIVAE